MDAGQDDGRGGADRASHRRPVRSHHESQAASRTLPSRLAAEATSQGFRSCLGIIGLGRSYGVARLEAASERGNTIGATSYGSIASILKHGLDKAFANDSAPDTPPIRHGNIRGSGYFH